MKQSSSGDVTPTLGSLGLQSLAWSSAEALTYQQWIAVGRRLGVVGRGSAWWIGDWIRFGASRYGGRYKVATQLTGYDEQTLTNMAWVASRFEISRRRENLTWSHHAELAALDSEEQEVWLDRSERHRLTIRKLRRALEEGALPEPPGEGLSSAESSDGGEVETASGGEEEAPVCPHCGQRLDLDLLAAEPDGRTRGSRRQQRPRSRGRG